MPEPPSAILASPFPPGYPARSTPSPASARSLRHITKRAAIGIGCGGTRSGNSSSDIFLAFSVANPGPVPWEEHPFVTHTVLNNEMLDPIYPASVEAIEEAVVNAIVAAVDVASVKPAGITVRAIDTAKLVALFRHA